MQSGSDYRVYAYTTIIRGDQIFPRLRSSGTSTRIYYLPINVESQGSHYASDAFYVNDRWVLGKRWTFNLGIRYDKNDGVSGDLLSENITRTASTSVRVSRNGTTSRPSEHRDSPATASRS